MIAAIWSSMASMLLANSSSTRAFFRFFVSGVDEAVEAGVEARDISCIGDATCVSPAACSLLGVGGLLSAVRLLSAARLLVEFSLKIKW